MSLRSDPVFHCAQPPLKSLCWLRQAQKTETRFVEGITKAQYRKQSPNNSLHFRKQALKPLTDDIYNIYRSM